jgi:hypothetical protein
LTINRNERENAKMKDAYFIVDDVMQSRNREGFGVMFGNPHTAIGTFQAEFLTLTEAKKYVRRHAGDNENFYRVFLARRHGTHKVKLIRADWMFKNSDGSLTAYALACGYLEQKEEKGIQVTLWHEGACYHVRGHDHNKNNRLFWDSFETNDLKGARKHYRAMVRKYIPVELGE